MSVLFSAIATLALGQTTMTEPRLLRYPTVSGDNVVFTYAGDLWAAKITGGVARELTTYPGEETRAHFSPDGSTIAFTGTYDGPPDIYTVPFVGGAPKRLTFDSEGDGCLGWTPDGKIAYGTTGSNFINRQFGLWLVDPQGGLPKKTVIDEVSEASFLPDGKTMVYNRQPAARFNWRRYRGGNQGVISLYNFATNTYSELPHDREQSFYPMAIGRDVYYISDKVGGVLNLFRYDLDSHKDAQLTHFLGADIRTPSTDGKSIVFERDGYLNVYDIASGTISKPNIVINSENLRSRPYFAHLADDVSSFSLSPSGVRLAVEARGHVFSVPASDGDTRDLTVGSGRERFPSWSPDGQTIAYISDVSGNYEVYTVPQMGGTPTQLTTLAKGTILGLGWTPDSKSLLLNMSDNSVWLLDATTKQLTKVTEAPYGLADLDVSPDSKWIAYTKGGPNEQAALFLYEIATGKTTQVDSGYFDDGNVAFDLNGKYLYITSDRHFITRNEGAIESVTAEPRPGVYAILLSKDSTDPLVSSDDEEPVKTPPAPVPAGGAGGPTPPAPDGAGPPPMGRRRRMGPPPPSGPPDVKIDFDGISDRVIALAVPPGAYVGLTGANNGVFITEPGSLSKFDFDSKATSVVAVGVGGFAFNPDRTKVAYIGPLGLGVSDVHPGPPITPATGKVDEGGIEATIDPKAEWKQMFWEAWRFERDHYYDANFRGQDWAAIGKHYADYLQYVNDRSDLSYVLGMLIGELGTSHSYVIGGQSHVPVVEDQVAVGYLGVDYAIANGHIQLAKIYRGRSFDATAKGPLNEPGANVNDGEYLLDIDGTPVTPGINPATLLLDKVGKFVTLTVNSKPTEDGARKVRVRPVGSEAMLRYYDMVDSNRRLVDKLSGGKIGYLHVPNTSAAGAVGLAEGFYGQTDKQALIVDERWNGGGNLPNGFVEMLKRKYQTVIQQRNAATVGDARAMEGPEAMLINGYAGSGGDMFPWLFRHEGVGPLIGTRTWGGLVGIGGGAQLVDGGEVTAPEFSIYDPATGEIIAENHGIDPDINVDRRPDLVAQGHDPQIEAAVSYLLDQLQKNPAPVLKTIIPTVNKLGRIGG